LTPSFGEEPFQMLRHELIENRLGGGRALGIARGVLVVDLRGWLSSA